MPDTKIPDLSAAEKLIQSTVESLQEVTGCGIIMLPADHHALLLSPDGLVRFVTPQITDPQAPLDYAWGNMALIRALFDPSSDDIRNALELRIQAQIDHAKANTH